MGNVVSIAGRFIGGICFEARRWWFKDRLGLH